MAKTEKKEKKQKRFFKDFKAELKKVAWPTSKQVVNNTTAVVTIVLITALLVFALDFTFDALNKYGINSLRTKIEENSSNEVTENETTENLNEVVENEEIDQNQIEENTVEE